MQQKVWRVFVLSFLKEDSAFWTRHHNTYAHRQKEGLMGKIIIRRQDITQGSIGRDETRYGPWGPGI